MVLGKDELGLVWGWVRMSWGWALLHHSGIQGLLQLRLKVFLLRRCCQVLLTLTGLNWHNSSQHIYKGVVSSQHGPSHGVVQLQFNVGNRQPSSCKCSSKLEKLHDCIPGQLLADIRRGTQGKAGQGRAGQGVQIHHARCIAALNLMKLLSTTWLPRSLSELSASMHLA